MAEDRTREILDRTLAGERLSSDADAVTLLEEGNLLALGASTRRGPPAPERSRASPRTSWIATSTTPTSASTAASSAPSTGPPAAPRGLRALFDQIGEKIQEPIDLGGTGVLLQGGVNGDLPFSFYEDMFRFIRKTFPTIHLHALSAPEVYFLQKITKWPLRDVISRLRDAGLQLIPGGGAEILEDSVRERIWALTKSPTEKWMEVHEWPTASACARRRP